MQTSLGKWLLVLALGVIGGSPLWAAPVPPAYDDLLRDWYARYLGRAIEPQALAYWGEKMVREKNPAIVQADILASGEYYQKHGATPIGFIRGLFQDEFHREPTPRELDRWLAEYENIPRRDRFVESFLRVPQPMNRTQLRLRQAGVVVGAASGLLLKAIIEGLLADDDDDDDFGCPRQYNTAKPPPPPRPRPASVSTPVSAPAPVIAPPLKLGKERSPR